MPARIKSSNEDTQIVIKTKKSSKGSGHASIVPISTEVEGGESKIMRNMDILSTTKKPLVPKGMNVEEIEDTVINWAKSWAGSMKDDRRTSKRGNKKFIMPTNYIFVPNNSVDMHTMKVELRTEEYKNMGKSISDIVIQRIWVYGRRTIDELVDDLKAIDPAILTICVNDLINQCWLKKVNEVDEKTGKKIITVELVTKADRKRLLKKKN